MKGNRKQQSKANRKTNDWMKSSNEIQSEIRKQIKSQIQLHLNHFQNSIFSLSSRPLSESSSPQSPFPPRLLIGSLVEDEATSQ